MTQARWRSSFHPRWMLATVLSVVGVLALTHIPQEAVPRVLQENAFDKIEHMVAYGLITTLFLLSLRRPIRPGVLVLGLAVLAGIGALDELTQPYVNRTASLWDYVGDLTGMALAGTIFLIRGRLGRYRPGRPRDNAGKGTVPSRSA